MSQLEVFYNGDIAEIVANYSSGYVEGTKVKIIDKGFWEPWYFTTEMLEKDFSGLTQEEISNHPRVRAHSSREMKLIQRFSSSNEVSE